MKSYTTVDTQRSIDARFVAELFQTDKFMTEKLFSANYWGRVKETCITEKQLREWITKFNRFDVIPRFEQMLLQNHRNNS